MKDVNELLSCTYFKVIDGNAVMLVRHKGAAKPWELRVTSMPAYTPEAVQRFGSLRDALLYAKAETPEHCDSNVIMRDANGKPAFTPENGRRFTTLNEALSFAKEAKYFTRAEAIKIMLKV